MLCDYGCGLEAKFQMSNGKWCCEQNWNSCPGKRMSCSLRISKAHQEGRCIPPNKKALAESTEIRRINRQRMLEWKITQLPFDQLNKKHQRIKLLKEQENRCAICNNEPIWNNKPISFHIDHIDGDHSNNIRSNVRAVCPNCHSQTETFGSRNLSSEGRKRLKQAGHVMQKRNHTKNIQKRKFLSDSFKAII
jgi:hypothetical protein